MLTSGFDCSERIWDNYGSVLWFPIKCSAALNVPFLSYRGMEQTERRIDGRTATLPYRTGRAI